LTNKQLILYFLGEAIYNLFFHPIANVPGPFFGRISNIPYTRWFWDGYFHRIGLNLHAKYGPVVRVAPNLLSFDTETSYREIYCYMGGRTPFIKGGYYTALDRGKFPSIVSTIDPAEHSRMRKLISHAFSARSLGEQEELVHNHVDQLVTQLQKTSQEGDDIMKWFNYTTFDIIGDLGFGESFGCLEKDNYHFWVKNVLATTRILAHLGALSRFPFRKLLNMCFLPAGSVKGSLEHLKHTREKVMRRINSKSQRPDFFTRILEAKEAQNITIDELQSHSSSFIVAGSETTATALSAAVYYILKNPDTYHKLVQEVRSSFAKYDDITGHAADRLPYLRAVIQEGFRLFPPAPNGFPRTCSGVGETVDGVYVPKGVEVFTHTFSAFHNPKNFKNPEEFLPERWLDGEKYASDRKGALQPFSLGPRACIGRK
jgi:cytochrome P450